MQQYCNGSTLETTPRDGVCQKGEQVFYAYCAKHNIDHTQPRPKTTEAFQWIGDMIPEEREGRYFIRGRAIHPCKTYHPQEWPEVRVYLEEELAKSAPTLSGKSLLLDHAIILDPPNRVLKATWEDGVVEYVAEVDDEIYEGVKSGAIKTRQPQSYAVGEFREEVGNVMDVWDREIESIFALYRRSFKRV